MMIKTMLSCKHHARRVQYKYEKSKHDIKTIDWHYIFDLLDVGMCCRMHIKTHIPYYQVIDFYEKYNDKKPDNWYYDEQAELIDMQTNNASLDNTLENTNDSFSTHSPSRYGIHAAI